MSFGGACLGVGTYPLLYCVPSLHVDDGFAVVFNNEVSKLEDANKEAVGVERFIGVDGAE